jgi:predicted lactoylglutathione lyase
MQKTRRSVDDVAVPVVIETERRMREKTMKNQIHVNLPVKDLKRSSAFFKSIGFQLEPKFSNDQASCVILGKNMFAMLLVERFFKTFTNKSICDATESAEVLVCLSCESRANVDDLVKKAVAAGGRVPREPQDQGFMYGHGFEDLDGHIWELIHMEPNPEMKFHEN